MNKQLLLLGAALAVIMPTGASANYWTNFQDDYMVNPYVSAAGGVNIEQEHPLDDNGIGYHHGVSMNPGWAGTAAFGVHLPYGFRTELEGGYRFNTVHDVHGFASPATGGHEDSWSAMWNVLYDIRNPTRFTPYIGGGLGAVWLSYENVHPVAGTTAGISDNMLFAMQAIGGVDYKISDHFSTYAQYEYMSPFHTHADLAGGGEVDTRYQNHTIMVGLKYAFNAPRKPEPARKEYTAEKTTTVTRSVQTDVNSYLVFFDFNSTELTPEAKKILQTAADNANRRNITKIEVTGHTDTVGSDAYNMRLSKRRAEAVKAALLDMGLKSTDITTIGKGKTDLLVPTADGVREPQNRRVEIVYGK